MAISLTSNYAGEVLEDFMTRSTMGAQTLQGGYMAVHSMIKDKKSLPRIQMANIIQDHSAAPTSAGSITVDERILQPVPFLVYQTFNPRDFEAFWEFSNSADGDLLDRDLPQAAQVKFLQQISMLVGEFFEDAVWQGTTANGASVLQDKWNGIITRAAAGGSGVNTVGTPVTLTATNIAEKIEATRDVLVAVGSRGRAVWTNVATCKIFMSHKSADLYREYLEQTLTYKGPTITDNYSLTYQGREIVPLQGMPDDTILITKASSDPLTSNLHFGVDWQYNAQQPVIQIQRYRPEQELFFFKVLMQADTNYTWAEEIGFYKA